MLAALSLALREWRRFVRQRNRLLGAVGQPVVFWALLALGLGPSFRMPGAPDGPSYGEYLLPGMLVLILLFTAIFSTISIIEDRREGFLQAVLVAPTPRWALVLGKFVGGAAVALLEGVIFLGIGWAVVLDLTPVGVLGLAGFCFLAALGLTGLGFLIAWRSETTQGFHAVMNLFLMPLWLLSGAFFPPHGWLGTAMLLNPVTYIVAGTRRLMYLEAPAGPALQGLPGLPLCWAVAAGFALAMFLLSCLVAARRTTGDAP
jgi:ABC-2 type transport system permease protein